MTRVRHILGLVPSIRGLWTAWRGMYYRRIFFQTWKLASVERTLVD